MEFSTDPNIKEKIYNEFLQEIKGIKFTPREIDTISCIVHNRKEKKIAVILSISPRTVSTHVLNILNKLGHSSRDYIIDFVEKSGKLQYFRNYYFQLVLQSTFEKQLQKIATVINRARIICSTDFVNISEVGGSLLQRIQYHLSLANIALVNSKEKSENTLYHLCIIGNSLVQKPNQNNVIFLLLDRQTNIEIPDQLKLEYEYIDFTNNTDYYLSLLSLLKKIILKPELDTTIEKFIKEQTEFKSSFEVQNIKIIDHISDLSKANAKKHKFFPIILFLSVAMFGSFLGFVSFQKQPMQLISEAATNIEAPDKTEEWNLPPFIDHYTQRHEITNAIWQKFKENGDNEEQGQSGRKTAILVGLHGLGGIGKTTLAKHTIHYPQQDYSFKGWFSAENQGLLQADYFALGEKHHLFTKDISVKQKIALIKEWLEKQNSILLVYDNVLDMDMLQEYLPNKGDIIITSRNHNLPGAIEVDVMTEDEATKLLDNPVCKLLSYQAIQL